MDCKSYILENLDNIDFKDEIAKAYPTHFYSFSQKIIYKTNYFIDISLVKGTNHPDYRNKRWIEVLKSLKRESNLKLNCDENQKNYNLKYYYDLEYRNTCLADDAWSINVLNDDDYFICDGNHRSTIAKFLSTLNVIPKMIPVPRVSYYYFNEEEIKFFDRLNKAIERLNKYSLENKFYVKKIEKKQKKINFDKKSDEAVEEFQIIYKLTIYFHDYESKDYNQEYYNLEQLKIDMFTKLKEYRFKTKPKKIESIIEKIIKIIFS